MYMSKDRNSHLLKILICMFTFEKKKKTEVTFEYRFFCLLPCIYLNFFGLKMVLDIHVLLNAH